MSTESGSAIATYFRVCDGVRIRFADTGADSDTTLLLVAPWPESVWAFRRIWGRLTPLRRIVAVELPGLATRTSHVPSSSRRTPPASSSPA
jgi:pimeloyl-ACP methyl ester carboxylesterase